MATVLIVEDEPTIREVVCDILSTSHECHAVRTAEEGLALLAAGAFDVVVTDVKLPEMDGDEFMSRVHAANPALPVIVISGGYGYDENRFLDAGAFGYLLKPFPAEELESLVARAAGGAPD
ncbi:MAG: response regulator [Acidobacteria bacterium]|nr:response regulator [Acidobacteriota bacterium]